MACPVPLSPEDLQEPDSAEPGRKQGGPGAQDCGLTDEEIQVVLQAAVPFLRHDGFLPSFQDFLFYHFRSCCPALARKVARLSNRQVTQLYRAVKQLPDVA